MNILWICNISISLWCTPSNTCFLFLTQMVSWISGGHDREDPTLSEWTARPNRWPWCLQTTEKETKWHKQGLISDIVSTFNDTEFHMADGDLAGSFPCTAQMHVEWIWLYLDNILQTVMEIKKGFQMYIINCKPLMTVPSHCCICVIRCSKRLLSLRKITVIDQLITQQNPQ